MPIHDWTRADAGLLHHFHQDWTIGPSWDAQDAAGVLIARLQVERYAEVDI
jgi:hypothetical protein